MTTWVRHSCALSWCAVEGISGGSVRTHCRGRFSERDTYEQTTETPIANRCDACERRVAELAQIEVGLEEMRRSSLGTEQYQAGIDAFRALLNLRAAAVEEHERAVDDRFDQGDS